MRYPIERLHPENTSLPSFLRLENDSDAKQSEFQSDQKHPRRKDNSWGKPGQPFSFFETAGHTILHEMTHLDQLGSKHQEAQVPLKE